MRVEDGFQPTPFPEEHPYSDDPVLPSLLKRLIPDELNPAIQQDLVRFGNAILSDVRTVLPPVSAPTLTQYDQFGRRIDRLETSETWKKLEALSIQEGLVSIAYERKAFGPSSRVYMFAKGMMSVGDFHVVGCPFAMTDGSARVMELSGSDAMKQQVLPRLLSRNPEEAYLAGQWMTERPGGSDVSQTETVAKPTSTTADDLGPAYTLEGFKWFSSAAEGNLSVALARTGSPTSGSRGLSLFLVPLRMGEHATTPLSNNILLHRLKNKFGTIGLPTAELSINNARAWRIGKENEGVRLITPVLNITRIHSSMASIGSLQRGLSIARSYATVRAVNGGRTLLKDTPLHVQTLADVTLIYRALTHFVFGAVLLLGKTESEVATRAERDRLRLLTPAVKAFSSSLAPTALLECMAALGGLGYMEETGIGRLLRDSSVEKIWEGTFNILALDVQRAAKDPRVLNSYITWADEVLSNASGIQVLAEGVSALKLIVSQLPSHLRQTVGNPLAPGLFLTLFASVTSALYLLEHASWSTKQGEPTADIDAEAFNRWVLERDLDIQVRQLQRLSKNMGAKIEMDLRMVYEGREAAKL